jgi:poly-gamma-glutamate synthesis protein (capsule biosynthesis protein)
MDDDCLKLLNLLNCTHVATANNHFFDYGMQGIKDTYDYLQNAGIEWTGSGINESEARKGIILEKNGLTIGIVNICENEWTTVPENIGGCNGLNLIDNYSSIEDIKSRTDFFIIIFHGGHEHYDLPSLRIKKLMRHFVELGAAAIVCHHTHVYSGFEVYKQSPIFYSLGNFLFDRESERDNAWNYGMLVNLKFDKQRGVSYTYNFIEQNNHTAGVSLLSQDLQNNHIEKFQSLSRIIQDDVMLESKYDEFITKQNKLFNFWLNPYPSKLYFLFYKGLLPSLVSPNKRKLLANLIRCESHRDVLQSVLKN